MKPAASSSSRSKEKSSPTGERAATSYTLIGNAHRAGLNSEAYLTKLFERLPSATTKTVNQLTPHSMAARRRAAAPSAAAEQAASNLATA